MLIGLAVFTCRHVVLRSERGNQGSAEISNFIAHRRKHTAHPPCGENARCHGFARTRFCISNKRVAELNELFRLAVYRRKRRQILHAGENDKEPWFPELN